jgi:2-dehydro-3-deoxyphosphogluconate aldolase/(4S)-4-hydroxy-2-oxoglutarate aldolase
MTATGQSILQKLITAPIVPTVFPIALDILRAYIRALHEENYPALEVLCRPPEAGLEILAGLQHVPERELIAVGAGTVTSAGLAKKIVRLKPDFIVSPAFSRRVLTIALDADIPYLPGVCSFQDVQDVTEAFHDAGLTVRILKLCPLIGLSPAYVQMLAGCFPGIYYCPTGDPGVESLKTYQRWKRVPNIIAPMGSGFIPHVWLEQKKFQAIAARLRKISKLAKKEVRCKSS